jgi:Ni/Co efflux regulator RcnB
MKRPVTHALILSLIAGTAMLSAQAGDRAPFGAVKDRVEQKRDANQSHGDRGRPGNTQGNRGNDNRGSDNNRGNDNRGSSNNNANRDRGDYRPRTDQDNGRRHDGNRDNNRDNDRRDWNRDDDRRDHDRRHDNDRRDHDRRDYDRRHDNDRHDNNRRDWDRGRDNRHGWYHGPNQHNPRLFRDFHRRDFARHRYHYHGGYYSRPHGFYSRIWIRGDRLPFAWYARPYIVYNWHPYGLYTPPYGHQWVRVDSDILLISLATGVVVDVIYDLYY